ncbi:MAG TPA: GNAT family N-acetyltransferase [Candidatus Marinimicrobia bacterium]|nr:GNAT family N-acetyltransferase [Candidatus Neomarinimicrobiota bacterium]
MQHQIRIAGEEIILRPPEIDDFRLYFNLASDQKTAELSDDHHFIKPQENSFRTYYERCLMPASEAYLPFVICDIENNVPVGQIHAGNIEMQHKNCMIGFQILPQFRRRGYCSDAIETLLDYLYYDLNMERVGAEVYEFNTASLQLLINAGFHTEGRLRRWLNRFGKRWDKILLSQLRSDWEQDSGAEEWILSKMIVCVFDKSNFITTLQKHPLEKQTEILQEYYEATVSIIEAYGGEILRFFADSGIAIWNPELREKLFLAQKALASIGLKSAWSEGEVVIGPFGFGNARQKDILGNPVNEAFKKLNQLSKGEYNGN